MLKDDSAVAALVGTRIYPELAEEGAVTPYVVYSVVSNTPVDTKESAPVDEAQLEVFSVADTYAAANDLADKVRTALARQEKVVYDTVTVQSIKYTNEVTEVSSERNLFMSVQDYTARTVGVIARPSFLFDSFGGALGAYSLRQLNASYTGAAVTVRRESDNATKDIGFDVYGNLQQGDLEAFCAGTNGFVSVFKDQSGNGNDATQTITTKQPQLVINGVIVKQNGLPTTQWVQGTDTVQSELDVNALAGVITMTNVIVRNPTDNDYLMFHGGAEGAGPLSYVVADEDNTNIDSSYRKPAATHKIYYNGVNVPIVSGTTTRANLYTAMGIDALAVEVNEGVYTAAGNWATFRICGYNGRGLDGYISELVVYNSDQSANRTGIESNIMTHYSIT